MSTATGGALGGPHRTPGARRPPASLRRLAATAIALVWGGIVVIGHLEQLLPPGRRWWGHAFVHVWIAGWATAIAVRATRLARSNQPVGAGGLRTLVVAAGVLATVAAGTNLLEIVGAYPAFRAFHDAVHLVGGPVGWLLLGNLSLVVLLGRREHAAPG